jgi:hypothetical protein
MSKQQIYYEVLMRTDHPVFYKDYAQTTTIDSPLNSILNRIFADQLAKFKTMMDELRLNMYPITVTDLTIEDWEYEYFGFTKPGLPLPDRVNELFIKVNKRFHMNISDVIELSRAIVGITPAVTRNVNKSGWVLGQGTLGLSTTFGGGSVAVGFYLVSFPVAVNSSLLAKLDERLTIIEKAGSRHKVFAPIPKWVLGRAPLGINTTLGVN